MPDTVIFQFFFFFFVLPTICAGSSSLRIFKPQEDIKVKFQIVSIKRI